jgi:hypothetical protein
MQRLDTSELHTNDPTTQIVLQHDVVIALSKDELRLIRLGLSSIIHDTDWYKGTRNDAHALWDDFYRLVP